VDKDAIVAWVNERIGKADDSPLELGYRLHHGQRVAALAVALADRMELAVDRDILYVGALLHDVGKAGGQPGKGHGERGADIIRSEIPDLFSESELERVCYIVANHYMRPNELRAQGQTVPELTDEVLLVQDADVLDHVGVSGVWIDMFWSAHDRMSPNEALEQCQHDRSDLERLTRFLNYDLSKIELEARWTRQQHFYTLLRDEQAGCLAHLQRTEWSDSDGIAATY